MRVGENITLYAGMQPVGDRIAEGAETEQEKQEQRRTIFVGELNQGNTLQDRIAQKKEQAQKQAMKVVGDAFAGDRSIDEDMESRRRHVEELNDEKKRLQEEAAAVAGRRESLEKAYEAGEVSQADYASETMDISREEQVYQEKLAENENTVLEENAIIRGTRLERLKHNPMGEARKQADAIMEAAGEEIVGMVMEDAKEKVDEESEKREQQAEKIEEEREEQEKFIEKQKEHRKEKEEILENVPVEEMVSLKQTQEDVRQEVQNILDKMKLLAEDIKGAAVDETL